MSPLSPSLQLLTIQHPITVEDNPAEGTNTAIITSISPEIDEYETTFQQAKSSNEVNSSDPYIPQTDNCSNLTPTFCDFLFTEDVERWALSIDIGSGIENFQEISDTEGLLYNLLEHAYEGNHIAKQIFYLDKMGRVVLKNLGKFEDQQQLNGEFSRAAHLFNAALSLTKIHPNHAKDEVILFSRLEELERLYLQIMFGKEPPATHRDYIFKHRQSLIHIRNGVQELLERNEPIKQTQMFLTHEYQRILCQLVEETILLIGQTPPTKFAIMGLGSMAREEMSIYSDVEFAFLIEKSNEEILHYFRRLSLFLELKVLNL